jgi:hypothetical protein
LTARSAVWEYSSSPISSAARETRSLGNFGKSCKTLERHIDSKLNGVEERLEKSLLDLSSRLP